MRWIWEPLARWAGVKEKRSVVRFAEQGWNLLYYSVFLTLGVVSAVRSRGRSVGADGRLVRRASTSSRPRRIAISRQSTSTLDTPTMLSQLSPSGTVSGAPCIQR